MIFEDIDADEEIWRLVTTTAKVGYTDRQLRNLEGKGEFPKRFALSPTGRAKGHFRSEVLEWMRTRGASREVA